jgi:hypothetical protein
MPTDVKKQRKGYGKAALLVTGIAVLIAGLSGAWYYAANLLDGRLTQFSSQMKAGGAAFDCDGQTVRGYPFRIGLFCDRLFYSDPSQDVEMSAGELRSAAQLYRPGHVVAELDSPARIRLPMLAPLMLEWDNLRTSTNLTTSGLERVSVEVASLDVNADDGGFLSPLGRIDELQAHAREAPEGDGRDLQLAFTADNWKIGDPAMTEIAPVDMSASLTIEDLLPALLNGSDIVPILKRQGGKAEIESFVFETADGGRLALSGPISVSRRGRLSGLLRIDLDNPDRLTRFIEQVFPPAAENMRELQVYFEALGDASNGEASVRGLTISIRDGDVFAGFFKVAEAPRLF